MIRAKDIPLVYARALITRRKPVKDWLKRTLGLRQLPLNLVAARIALDEQSFKGSQPKRHRFYTGAFSIADEGAGEPAILSLFPDPLTLPAVRTNIRIYLEALAPKRSFERFMAQREDMLRKMLRSAAVRQEIATNCSLLAIVPRINSVFCANAVGPFGAPAQYLGLGDDYWAHLDDEPSLKLYLDPTLWLQHSLHAWQDRSAPPSHLPLDAMIQSAAWQPQWPLLTHRSALNYSPTAWPWCGRDTIDFVGDVTEAKRITDLIERSALNQLPAISALSPKDQIPLNGAVLPREVV